MRIGAKNPPSRQKESNVPSEIHLQGVNLLNLLLLCRRKIGFVVDYLYTHLPESALSFSYLPIRVCLQTPANSNCRGLNTSCSAVPAARVTGRAPLVALAKASPSPRHAEPARYTSPRLTQTVQRESCMQGPTLLTSASGKPSASSDALSCST